MFKLHILSYTLHHKFILTSKPLKDKLQKSLIFAWPKYHTKAYTSLTLASCKRNMQVQFCRISNNTVACLINRI